jgi:rubredoxin
MRKYKCRFCSHVYDEAAGDPETGIAAGTRFEDIPEDWICPECGATKEDYELVDG